MFILNGTETQIINSEFVERFCVADKPDASLVLASYGREREPVTLARYKDHKEAAEALKDLLVALAGGQVSCEMPPSRLSYEERQIKDARVKRRGGS